MEQEAKIKVKSKGKGFCNVESENGVTLTLQLSDKVKRFYKYGLDEGKSYYIKYDDETNILLYAIEDDKDNSKSKGNREDMILKQVALKCTSYNEDDIDKVKHKARSYLKFLKEDW